MLLRIRGLRVDMPAMMLVLVVAACGSQQNDNACGGNCPDVAEQRMDKPTEIDPQDRLVELIEGELDTLDYAFSGILARHGPYLAVSSRRLTDSVPHVMALDVQGSAIVLMSDPFEYSDWALAPTVEWVSLNGDSVDHLRITVDDFVEGWVETQLFRIDGDTLISDYRDGDDRCKASDLLDLDGDGRLELIMYSHHPNERRPLMCNDGCQVLVHERFDMPISWAEVHSWNGDRWIPSERAYPQFYRGMADTYDEMRAWVLALPDLSREYCERHQWFGGGLVLQEWAARARQIAAGER